MITIIITIKSTIEIILILILLIITIYSKYFYNFIVVLYGHIVCSEY